MNCWHCQTELIWGGDHDLEDEEDYIMVTNLSCPKCNSHVDVYYPERRINMTRSELQRAIYQITHGTDVKYWESDFTKCI